MVLALVNCLWFQAHGVPPPLVAVPMDLGETEAVPVLDLGPAHARGHEVQDTIGTASFIGIPSLLADLHLLH